MAFVRPAPEALSVALDELAALFGNRLVTSQAVRAQHMNVTNWSPGQPPDAVLFPKSKEDVQQAVRICARHGVPIIAFGAGSSLEGHVNAPLGGLSVDMRDMNEILSVNVEDMDCTVQPGVTRKQLNAFLRDQGLFFPIDPGADAQLGGMAATRASGTMAVRYGTMRDAVLNLEVVLASGEIMTTARRARKTSAGYDLTRLVVGSEGTLGIITQLSLRLHPIPDVIAGGLCRFASIRSACDAAITAIQMSVPFARVELVDAQQIRLSNAYSHLNLPEEATLFVEFHGSATAVKEQAETFAEVAAEFGGSTLEWSANPEDAAQLWKARHDAFWADKAARPGAEVVITDVCVPMSRLAECVEETQADLAQSGIVAPIFGHIGDGNFHTIIPVTMDDTGEVARVKAFVSRLSMRAIAMDGTCTGEHGIGDGKQKYLLSEVGIEAVGAMRAIKQALDPQGVMNPGKIF